VVSINRGEYCISKAGASMMTKLYAVRLAESGIGVYEVRPGIIRTDMTKVSEARLDQLIKDSISPIKTLGRERRRGADRGDRRGRPPALRCRPDLGGSMAG
jgi:NAD(P)-dependent dehydrogenase (short-subunit alcohol dehydrogenase family)